MWDENQLSPLKGNGVELYICWALQMHPELFEDVFNVVKHSNKHDKQTLHCLIVQLDKLTSQFGNFWLNFSLFFSPTKKDGNMHAPNLF